MPRWVVTLSHDFTINCDPGSGNSDPESHNSRWNFDSKLLFNVIFWPIYIYSTRGIATQGVRITLKNEIVSVPTRIVNNSEIKTNIPTWHRMFGDNERLLVAYNTCLQWFRENCSHSVINVNNLRMNTYAGLPLFRFGIPELATQSLWKYYVNDLLLCNHWQRMRSKKRRSITRREHFHVVINYCEEFARLYVC